MRFLFIHFHSITLHHIKILRGHPDTLREAVWKSPGHRDPRPCRPNSGVVGRAAEGRAGSGPSPGFDGLAEPHGPHGARRAFGLFQARGDWVEACIFNAPGLSVERAGPLTRSRAAGSGL